MTSPKSSSCTAGSTACCLAAGVLFVFSAVQAATTCENLTSLALPDTTITLAQSVAAGAFTAPAGGRGGRGGDPNAAFKELPAFCRVAATMKPTSDSDIKFEIWLPASGWNGKFEANGNGGWTGSITPATLAAGLQRGYAAAMTDTGHEGGSASFALGHPEKLVDWGYRAAHEMTVKSKAIIAAYYGDAPKLSYWNGCSAGGRAALKEAQRYPEDFNGIVAGSPGINWTGRSVQAVWIAQGNHKDEASTIPPAKFPVIHNAALEACDAADGVKDGIIEDPTRCKFDPQVLECKGPDGPACLTTPQVETARRIYASVTNPRTKQEIFPGHEPGSELGWNTMVGPQPFGVATELFKFVVFKDPNWDYRTFNFDSDVALTAKADDGVMNALDPNLKAFIGRGGKIVQYHGWSDPQISPLSSVRYYDTVLDTLGGASKVTDSYRLFMVPGMAHCGGGEGTSNFDMLSAVEQWVEAKRAPDQIPASRVRDGKVDRTRPLCPYPQLAKYKGTGSIDDAANFSCKL
jgi:feruloyl esterase